MERFMYQDESFERMLKDKADEYRMYPSQQSWDNIQKRIQPKSRLLNFKSIGLSAALLLGFAISISDEQTRKETAGSFAASLVDEQDPSNTAGAQENTAKVIPITTAIRINPVSQEFSETMVDPDAASSIPPAEEEVPSLEKARITINPTSLNSSLTGKPTAGEVKAIDRTAAGPTVLVESAVNEVQEAVPVVKSVKRSKQLQFYIASSASYRVLYNDNKLTFGNILQQDPDKVARHSPSLGMEFGAAILLPISKNIDFRTGIQLNYTRYNVEVFRTTPQVATVIMNNNAGVIQRVTSLNSQNNNGLSKSGEVANETYQLSLPVGLEFKLAGKRKLHWNLATNVQPTYLISASGYMLTNNYEKYIKAPDLLSNLNLNTSLETFLRWNVKEIQLQAGPQLRYQLFSNSQEGYPIKEHLVDYGFRIGIIKTLK